jgi:hypothetical protein
MTTGQAPQTPQRRGERQNNTLLELIDRILDKGIVIDAWVRVSLLGIELLTIEARVVVSSIETYLHYAEAIANTALSSVPPPQAVEPTHVAAVSGEQRQPQSDGQQMHMLPQTQAEQILQQSQGPQHQAGPAGQAVQTLDGLQQQLTQAIQPILAAQQQQILQAVQSQLDPVVELLRERVRQELEAALEPNRKAIEHELEQALEPIRATLHDELARALGPVGDQLQQHV